jgi:hypothetical protein
MAQRLYITKLIGDGLSPWTRYRPSWFDVIGETHSVTSGCIEFVRYMFWIGIIDTTDTEHALMIATPTIRYIPQTVIGTTIANLTAPQLAAVQEVLTYLGFPANIWSSANARVADVLFYIMGRATWNPVSQAS